MRFRRVGLFVLAMSVCLQSQTARQHHARLSLVSDTSDPHASWVGVRFELDPGWHIYWTNPGDSGEPPKITWQAPAGYQIGKLEFPTPQRIQDHSLIDYGYQGSTVLLAPLTTSSSGTPKDAEIAATVKFLVCREVCVPDQDKLSTKLKADPEQKREVEQAKAQLPQPIPHDVAVTALKRNNDFLLTVRGSARAVGEISDFIPADANVIENTAKPQVEKTSNGVRIRLKAAEQLQGKPSRLRGLLVEGSRSYLLDIPVSRNKH